MATTMNDKNIYSSEVGLAGEIIQTCIAVATRLLKKAKSPSWRIYDAKSKANRQPPGALLSRKIIRLKKDGDDSIGRRYLESGNDNRAYSEKRSDIMPGPHTDNSAESFLEAVELVDTSRFEDVVGQLRLWADGLDVSKGRLDKALERSTTLKPALFAVFVETTSLLTRASWEILHDEESISSLQILTEKASTVSSKELLDGREEDDEDGDTKAVLDYETFIEEFLELIQALLELTPSLMDLQESWILPQLAEKVKTGTSQPELRPELPHDHFKRIIFDKYTDAQPGLVDRLAQACWNLYISVKNGLIQRENTMKKLALEDEDSAYESMLQSEMAPSLIGKLPNQVWDNASETTSLAEDSVILKDRPKIPRPPVEDIGPDIDFVCNICSRLQKDISNTNSWRKHVLADIRPYICSFDDCRHPDMRFATRSAWIQHEYTFHRQHFEWRCVYRTCPAFLSESEFLAHLVDSHKISRSENSELSLIAKYRRRLVPTYTDANIECSICLHSVPNQRSKIGRHLGRHMEDIALPILSIAVATDECTDFAEMCDEESSSNNESPVLYPHLASDDHTSDQLPYGDKSDPNRSDIARDLSHALKSASVSEVEDEDLSHALNSASISEVEEEDDKTNFDSGYLASDDHTSDQLPCGDKSAISFKTSKKLRSLSQGDAVLISYLDPNRPDIAREVSHALNSASVSEVEDEDLSHALKSASVSEVEEEDDETNFDSGSQGDSVLIRYLDPNRPDITEEVLSHALKPASVSEVEEEDDRTNLDSGS